MKWTWGGQVHGDQGRNLGSCLEPSVGFLFVCFSFYWNIVIYNTVLVSGLQYSSLHVCACVCVCVYIAVYVCVPLCVCVYIAVACVCVYMYSSLYVCACVCVCVYIAVYMCVPVCVYI